MDKLEDRVRRAMSADRDGIKVFLRDPSDKVVMALLSNINITEGELFVLAKRRDISGEALGTIAMRRFTDEGYKVRVALVNNPKTPRRAALGLLRGLRLRDTAFVTQNKQLPTELRQAAEGMLKEKMPTIPMGIRINLARQVSEEVLKALLMDDTPQLVKACFENPRMKEAVAVWAVNHQGVPAGVIGFISRDIKWSANYAVRFALIRNPHTPVERAMELVRGLKSMDQRFLYNDPSVSAAIKVQLEIELEKKGQPLFPPREEGRVIGIVGEDE